MLNQDEWIKLCEDRNPHDVTVRLNQSKRDALLVRLIKCALLDEKGPAAEAVRRALDTPS